MFQGMKSSRQLSLLIALALSVGGTAVFNHVHAADVTGGDVLVDAGHPAPTPTAAGNAHDIPGVTDNRNVTGNKLTVNGILLGRDVIGGYTFGN
ncbi:signal peptide peptidase SppA, partial [Centipeda periodontii DSM 2778]